MKKYKVRYWVTTEENKSFEYLSHLSAADEWEAAILAQTEIYELYSFAIECDLLSVEEDKTEGLF